MNKIITAIFLIAVSIYINSCSPSKRFSNKENENVIDAEQMQIKNAISVLLADKINSTSLNFTTSIAIFDGNKKANINAGKLIKIENKNDRLSIKWNDNLYDCTYAEIISTDRNKLLNYGNKNYRGSFLLFCNHGDIQLINTLTLDDYLKSVVPSEMPIGNGHNYNEALKAFTICARTYAISKLNKNSNYDIYSDVRDQVYSGAKRENDLTNSIVDETQNMILTYQNRPAVIYYSSTCGGMTEDVQNVFSDEHIPYLVSIKDGEPANCSISPRFNWEEKISKQRFISSLFDAKLINDKTSTLINIQIKSRFASGRIDELQITYSEQGSENQISIYGNKIRSIIRNSNNGILFSSNFSVSFDGDEIILRGKGYGHGVGMCQWGAIAQSKRGINYKKILEFYFPGTKVEKIND